MHRKRAVSCPRRTFCDGGKVTFEIEGAPHPGLRADRFHPIGAGRNETEILADMLLANPANGNNPAGYEGDRRAKDRLGHGYALGMMTQSTMSEIGNDLLRFVEPVMDPLVVIDRAAPFADTRQE